MLSLSYGELPDIETINAHHSGTYELGFSFHGSGNDYDAFQRAVNQGIDAHLEAIFFTTREDSTHAYFNLEDTKSLHVLLRRLCETGNDDLASCILSTIDIEWV